MLRLAAFAVASASLFATSFVQPSGAPVIVMADAFTTGTDLADRVPQFRGSSTWVQATGTWTVTAGQLRPPTAGAADRLVRYPGGVADAAVEATFVRAGSGTLGLVVRDNGVSSPASGVRRLQATVTATGVVSVAKVVGTASTVLGSTTVAAPPSTSRVRVEAVGASVQVVIDGAPVLAVVLSAADAAAFASFTWQGVVATAAGSERVDDVLVTRWP